MACTGLGMERKKNTQKKITKDLKNRIIKRLQKVVEFDACPAVLPTTSKAARN